MRYVPFLLLLLAAPVFAERPAELHRLPEPAGLGRLLTAPDAPRGALVILLPDALGDDGRAEPYAEALAARGLASLTLGLAEDADSPDAAEEPAAHPAAVAPALAWAKEAGFDPAQIGIMGFGLGGRAALVGSEGQPVAALYPGCAGLPASRAVAGLVLQGGDHAAGCGGLPDRGAMALRLLAGAGHAWDAPGAIWPSPGPVLPDPAGGGRVRARTDLAVTLEVADHVAAFFEAWLLHGARSAAR